MGFTLSPGELSSVLTEWDATCSSEPMRDAAENERSRLVRNQTTIPCFDVLLNEHLSIILVTDQLNAQIHVL